MTERPTIPVRLRVGCHVTDLGELDVDDTDPVATYTALADVLEAAVADLRQRVIPEVARG